MVTKQHTPPVTSQFTPESGFAQDGPPGNASVGERTWWWITYGGVGYGANLLLSLIIWDFFLTGHGRPTFDKVASSVAGMLKGGGMEAAAAHQSAETGTKMACSPLGGHVMMVPVKYLEDHAARITHFLNKILDPNYAYKDLELPADAPDDDYPPLVKAPNRNSWGQIALRRGLGWIAVTGAGMALHKSGFEEPLERGTLNVLGLQNLKVLGLQNLKPDSLPQRYAKLAALDAYFTVITSTITAITNRMFGKKRQDDEDMPDDALSIDIPGITKDEDNTPKAPAPKPVEPPKQPEYPVQPPTPFTERYPSRQDQMVKAVRPNGPVPYTELASSSKNDSTPQLDMGA